MTMLRTAQKTVLLRWLTPLLLVLLMSPVRAADEGAPDVDYVQLAARLIADGNYNRAERALSNVQPDAKGVDTPRYYTLLGLVDLRSDRHGGAIELLKKALQAHDERARKDPAKDKEEREERRTSRQRVHLYLAQAYMGQKEFRQALEALDASGEVGASIAMVHALRAQAHWELEAYDAAFTALNRGAERFPEDQRFMRRKVFYLINLGFYRQAAALGREYLKVAEAQPEDYVAIGSALRKSGQHKAALTILERARLEWPRNRDIAVELAHTWLGLDKVGAAAEVFSRASIFHPKMRLEAAELQRRAGQLYRSLLLNSAIADQQRKYRQRLAILVAMEQWDRAASMGHALRRQNLLESDDLRYAYAYALFKAGHYDEADRVLSGIGSGELFRKATELRKAMEQCREAAWQCL